MQSELINRLQDLIGPGHVHTDPEELVCYSYDATHLQGMPEIVVRPGTLEQVRHIMALAHERRLPVIPRGAGTNLSGGTVPLSGGIVLVTSRLNRILELDPEDFTVTVECGAITSAVHTAVEAEGLFYPPDPSSMNVSTIGGNIAECAGGPRALKYGVTRDYLLGLRAVLPDGTLLRTGGKTIKNVSGYDLTRLLCGSEGTLAVVVEATLRLIPLPEAKRTLMAIFSRLADAAKAVNRLLRTSIVPATIELMDDITLRTVEDYKHLGLPTDAEAALLIELDGPAQEVARQSVQVAQTCREQGARDVRQAHDQAQSDQLWEGRRSSLAALARARPTTVLEDATVPRSKIPAMVTGVKEIAERHNLMIAIFGHAGDGNLHPTILTDQRDPAEWQRVESAISEIFRLAVSLGGTLSGEHGIGVLKRSYLPWEFGEEGLSVMSRVKRAFDPLDLLNPGKMLPSASHPQ